MDLLNFTFAELSGIFLGFSILIYLVIVVFTGFMRFFERFFGDSINRIFHYHYHYRDRRK